MNLKNQSSSPVKATRPGIFQDFIIQGLLIVAVILLLGGFALLSVIRVSEQTTLTNAIYLPRLQATYRLSVDAAVLADLSQKLGQATTQGERGTIKDRIDSRFTTLDGHIATLERLDLPEEPLVTVRKVRDELMAGAAAISEIRERSIALRNGYAEGQGTMDDLEIESELSVLGMRIQNLLLRQEVVASRLTSLVTSLAGDAERQITRQQQRADTVAAQMRLALVLGMVASLGFSSWLYQRFRRRLIVPLLSLRDAMVLWRKDATPITVPEGAGEIVELGEGLNTLIDSVKGRTAELERLASIDSLTNLPNRRHFLAAAEQELYRCQRLKRPLAVLMGDIDHFKRINDSGGHALGDAVLKETAALWRTLLRDIDLCGRMGGEEFAAVLPEVDIDAARKVAERIRSAVASLEIPKENGSPVRLTISIGVATNVSDSCLEELLARADLALYAAKKEGRNRVR